MPCRKNDNYFEDLTDKVFGKRTVRWAAGRKEKVIMWLCTCECGKISIIPGNSLRNGGSSSCISCGLKGRNTTHGIFGSSKYRMFNSAKHRSKELGLPFDIELDDIVIPKICPLLGTPLIDGTKKGQGWSPNCASLDRKIPSLGYVKGNVWVISGRANVIKNDASLEELKLLVKNLEASCQNA